jgi:hypothetical protein
VSPVKYEVAFFLYYINRLDSAVEKSCVSCEVRNVLYIPEGDSLHSHRRENLKSFIMLTMYERCILNLYTAATISPETRSAGHLRDAFRERITIDITYVFTYHFVYRPTALRRSIQAVNITARPLNPSGKNYCPLPLIN